MRGNTSFLIIINSKDSKQAFKKSENQHYKRQKIESEGYFSALHNIITVYPPPSQTFPLCITPPNFQPLLPLFNPPYPPFGDWIQAFKKSENKHPKRLKTGSGDTAAGLAVVLVDLCSGSHNKKSNWDGFFRCCSDQC